MPFLHAHRRRVPAQDIDRSVVIGIGAEAAMATVKGRLAFAAFTVNDSAIRTSLRGIGRVNLKQAPPAFFEFVCEDGLETKPALVENTPVEPGFLPDVFARLAECAPRRGGHVLDVETFQHDRPETLADPDADLVVPITANAGASGGELSRAPNRDQFAARPALSAGSNSLCGAMALFNGGKGCGQGELLAVRKRQRGGDAAIYSDRGVDINRGYMLDFTSERNIPAESIQRDGGILNAPTKRTSVSELHPPNFRQTDNRPFGVESAGVYFATLKAEAIVDALLSRRRVKGTALKEVHVSLVQVTQRLLLASLRHGRYPIKFGAKGGQLTGLGCVVQPAPGVGFVLSPPVSALLKGEIVDQATDARKLPEQALLLRRRRQSIAKAAMDHAPDSKEHSYDFNRRPVL